MSDDCLFCKILAGDIPSDTVFENDLVYAFRDINPVAPTHVLIIPREHIPTLNALSPDQADVMGAMMIAAKQIADQEGVSDAYRLVVNNGEGGGQAVFHIHMHLIAGRQLKWPPG